MRKIATNAKILNFKDKSSFRQFCKRQLKQNERFVFLQKNQILKMLKKILLELNAKKVLFYLPLKHEVDVRPLIFDIKRELRYDKRLKIFVPKVLGVSFDCVEFRLASFKNIYHIDEPHAALRFPDLDVMIVPILGVDLNLGRIGFGKGMYDRFYAKLKKKPKIIFITKKIYFSNQKLTQSYDILGDFLIDGRVMIQRGGNVNRNRVGVRHRWRDLWYYRLSYC